MTLLRRKKIDIQPTPFPRLHRPIGRRIHRRQGQECACLQWLVKRAQRHLPGGWHTGDYLGNRLQQHLARGPEPVRLFDYWGGL